jgi:dephospho-CoA kinase
MCSDQTLRAGIIDLLGPESYQPDGSLNRGYVAGKVYGDGDLSKQLNALVHPAVEADYESWASSSHDGVPYTIKEAALLFEAKTYRRVHFVLHVSAPEGIRIERTLSRDPQRTIEQIEAIMALQLPENEREARSQYVLHNSGKESVIEQARALHALWVNK